MEGQILEGIWTALPACVLIQLAIPSLLLLYTLDEISDAEILIKVIGHQWYWSYEYSDFAKSELANIEFDSYMLPSDEATIRLLEVDNRTILPYRVAIRVLVGSTDVLHSWAVPALGVKIDACPGRLNHITMIRHRPGFFFGQCSEICGANHRFMPICVEIIEISNFINWLISITKQEA